MEIQSSAGRKGDIFEATTRIRLKSESDEESEFLTRITKLYHEGGVIEFWKPWKGKRPKRGDFGWIVRKP